MISGILTRAFADRRRMAPQPRFSSLGRAFSTFLTMCSGCFPSAAPGRPNVFGKTTTSQRTCGTVAAGSSGPNTAFQTQGMILYSNGRNGSSRRAVHQQTNLPPVQLGCQHRTYFLLMMRERVQGRPEPDQRPDPNRRSGCGAPGPASEAGFPAVMAAIML